MLTASEVSSFVLPRGVLDKTAQSKKASTSPGLPSQATVNKTSVTTPTAPTSGSPFASGLQINDGRPRSGTAKALQQLEQSYARLLNSIDLGEFDPKKIEAYIRAAEKRARLEMGEKEKLRLRKLAESKNPKILKLLALDLRVGIPKRAEQQAFAALGELLLNSSDIKALDEFLKDPNKDENLKAHVRVILRAKQVENVLSSVDEVKHAVFGLFGR